MAYRNGKIEGLDDDEDTAALQVSEISFFTQPVAPQHKDIWIEVIGVPPAAGSSIIERVYWVNQWVVMNERTF